MPPRHLGLRLQREHLDPDESQRHPMGVLPLACVRFELRPGDSLRGLASWGWEATERDMGLRLQHGHMGATVSLEVSASAYRSCYGLRRAMETGRRLRRGRGFASGVAKRHMDV